jgi:phospholipid/cholesterol/gamma-HCH transport system permease protein
MRGLQTRTGASAVGTSTTSAVVTSIVLVAIGNGIFAIIYYYLGI